MAKVRISSESAVSRSVARRFARRSAAGVTALCLCVASTQVACTTIGLRSAVSMKVNRAKNAPRDASVYIDEEFVGPLYYVAAHGVRLPTGTHRITITRDGYFPWDRLVEADRQPIALDVELLPVPD